MLIGYARVSTADQDLALQIDACRKSDIGSGGKSVMTPDKLDTAREPFAAGNMPARTAKGLQVGLSTFYRH